jgi:hypothetical protein
MAGRNLGPVRVTNLPVSNSFLFSERKIDVENPFQGILHVTGEPDTGKTLFALSCGYPPEKIAFVDDDIKGRATVNQIGAHRFAYYCDFVRDTAGMRELQVHQYGLETIEKIKARGAQVLIWDTWTRMERTCHPYVVKHPQEFREFWSPLGTIKGAEQWQVAAMYEAVLFEKLLDAAPLVILTTHLKDHFVGNARTGKQIPDSSKALSQKANLRIWLRHNENGPAPIGLVLKRPSKVIVEEGGIKVVNVLPRKLNPCTWEHILHYWENPIGNREPAPDEMPDSYELSILDDTLTADQKRILEISQRAAEQELSELKAIQDQAPKTIGQLLGELSKRNITEEQFLEMTGVQVYQIKERDLPEIWNKLLEAQ